MLIEIDFLIPLQSYGFFFIKTKKKQIIIRFFKKCRNFAEDMQQLDKDKAYWFVLGSATVNREIKICDKMRLQHIECFVPLKYEVKRVRNRRQETLMPAISGLIFAHGTEDEIKAYMLTSKDRLYFRYSTFSNHQDRLVVPEHEMRQFMDFITENQQVVNFFTPEEIEWREGELVKVTIGSTLYEGKIVRIKGKRKKMFALAIPNTMFATIELTPELMQSIQTEEQNKRQSNIITDKRQNNRITKKQDDRDDYRSKDLEADKKLLFEKSFRLLFVLSDQQISMLREYQVTQKEMERAMKRLAHYKGFTAATEGELALPMFMAAMVTGENTENATNRLKKAIERLKDTSILKFRMRFYLAKLTDNQEEMNRISETIRGWKAQGLQSKQRAFLEEVEGIL